MQRLLDYFVPKPPHRNSEDVSGALSGGIWARHKHNQLRAENREWLRPRALTYSRRWASLAAMLWIGAWVASGHFLPLEAILALGACLATYAALAFLYVHSRLGTQR